MSYVEQKMQEFEKKFIVIVSQDVGESRHRYTYKESEKILKQWIAQFAIELLEDVAETSVSSNPTDYMNLPDNAAQKITELRKWVDDETKE